MGPNVVKYFELPKPSDASFHVGVYLKTYKFLKELENYRRGKKKPKKEIEDTNKYSKGGKQFPINFDFCRYVNNIMVGQGKGSNKQLAEKLAALDALHICKVNVSSKY